MDNPNIIKIEEIENSSRQEITIDFEDKIDGIDSDAPIYAEITLKSLGDLIKVEGHVEGEVNLECDLCLQKYKYGIDFELNEFFAKKTMLDEYGAETELKEGQFIEDLDGKDEIDIRDLLYQSVILNFPNKKICGINCKGNTFVTDEEFVQSQTDPRLEVFKNIKIKDTRNQ
jgi:uncharacterized metal-binding protein YceD (DUF177 family)